MNLPNILIRFATEEDAHAIATVHVASWQRIYHGHIPDEILNKLSVKEREQKWLELLIKKVKILVIEKDNVIVGFASLCAARDTNLDPNIFGEISAIYLDPSVWHQGLGGKLCKKALKELAIMGFTETIVWVLKENLQARRFYESMGFISTGDIKAEAYENTILNEVLYKKTLKNLVVDE